MSDVPEIQRQEIEALLAEIAADPDAKVLRVPRAENVLALAEQPVVGAHAPELSAVERHLLLSFREEAAYLLRERCAMLLHANDPDHVKWHRWVHDDEEYELASEADWRRRASAAAATVWPTNDAPGAEALRRTAREDVGSITELALASTRLVPSTSAQLYVALEHLELGQFETSQRELTGALESASTSEERSLCWENLGSAYSRGGRHLDAAEAYRRSWSADPSRSLALVYSLANAVQAGVGESVLSVGRLVDDVLVVDATPSRIGRSFITRALRADASSLRRAHQVRGLGEVSRSLIDAFSA